MRTFQNKPKPLPFSPNLLLAIAWNRKQYFDITYHLFLNFKLGTKCKKRRRKKFNWQRGGTVKIIFPVPYPIIHNPGF